MRNSLSILITILIIVFTEVEWIDRDVFVIIPRLSILIIVFVFLRDWSLWLSVVVLSILIIVFLPHRASQSPKYGISLILGLSILIIVFQV